MALDGKFSVYNSSGGGEAPPAEIKKPSPINFQYEWMQSASLSFDDELRMAMDKFHQSKQPSAVKVALKKWVAENTPTMLKFKPQAKKTAPKQPTKEFETPLFLKEFGQKISKLFDFEIELPSLPKVNISLPTQQIKNQLEKVANAAEKPLIHGYEKTREWIRKLQDKVRDLYEEISDKIPTEKIEAVIQFIQDIPQQFIIPAALWMGSFIPTETIKLSFRSGMERVSKGATRAFNFAKRSYQFTEKQIKRLFAYLNVTFITPVAKKIHSFFNWLLKILTALTNAIFPTVKRISVACYRLALRLPKLAWSFAKWLPKSMGSLSVRVVSIFD